MKPRPNEVAFLTYVDRELRAAFHALCLRRGRTMRAEITRFFRTELKKVKK